MIWDMGFDSRHHSSAYSTVFALGLADMARKLAVLGLAALLGTAAGASVQLTKDNFDAEVFDSGKHAFIKFQAPWSVTWCSSLEHIFDCCHRVT